MTPKRMNFKSNWPSHCKAGVVLLEEEQELDNACVKNPGHFTQDIKFKDYWALTYFHLYVYEKIS